MAISVSNESINLSDGQTEFVLPLRQSLLDDGLTIAEAVNIFSSILSGNRKLIVYSKKDFKHFLLDYADFSLSCACEDVSIMKYLSDFSGSQQTLSDVIAEHDLAPNTPATDLIYLHDLFSKKLEQAGMQKLYVQVELPLSDVLFEMELAGFKVDAEALRQTGARYKDKLALLESRIRELIGEETLNVNSPKQLGEVLFEKLKVAKGKKTKSGYSTSAEVLESIEDKHPSIPLILQYRQAQKLYSTYIEGFRPLIDTKTGLIHTSFNQTVTATGRLSSKEPNLQNIPVREEEGKELRKFFVPRDDQHVLIGADYSQIELRLLAAFSECKSLITAFNEGKDIHSATASKVFGVELDKVTPSMRSSAKAVNFGIIYGISEYGLAKNLKISPIKAREYISSYFKEYPEVKAYMDKNVDFARKTGYAETILGRKRVIHEIHSSNYNLRSFGERAAMNMPLQGSSADVIKLAMLGVHERLKKEKLQSKLILQVHDELIIDALISEKEKVEKILIEEMEGALKLSVPLTVSVGSGKNWFDAK